MAGPRLFGFTHELLELSLRLRSSRHEVLSGNIANADTPGFRPKDFDFNSLMKAAVEAGETAPNGEAQPGPVFKPTAGDIQAAIYEPEFPDDRRGEDRLDGNAVSLDRQMGLMTENSLQYETSLTLLSRALAGLRYVISEGKR